MSRNCKIPVKYDGDCGPGILSKGERMKTLRTRCHVSQAILAVARATKRGIIFSTGEHTGGKAQR